MWKTRAREILETGEIRGRLTVPRAAQLAGISRATYERRKADPGTMTLQELGALVRPMRITRDELDQLVGRGK